MFFTCHCGNVIKDGTDYLPYKARFIADQDYFDVLNSLDVELGRLLATQGDNSNVDEIVNQFAYKLRDALSLHQRIAYQCNNCGRLHLDGPEDRIHLEPFGPEDAQNWKKVFCSVNGEHSKPWMRRLSANWYAPSSEGRLWFDPKPGEKGGYEEFNDRLALEKRYYELFNQMQTDSQFINACFQIEPGKTVHQWHRS